MIESILIGTVQVEIGKFLIKWTIRTLCLVVFHSSSESVMSWMIGVILTLDPMLTYLYLYPESWDLAERLFQIPSCDIAAHSNVSLQYYQVLLINM